VEKWIIEWRIKLLSLKGHNWCIYPQFTSFRFLYVSVPEFQSWKRGKSIILNYPFGWPAFPVLYAGGLIGADTHSHGNDLWFVISADKWVSARWGFESKGGCADIHVARIINLKAAYHICSLYNYAWHSNGSSFHSKSPENKSTRNHARNFPFWMVDILVPFKEDEPWIVSNRISYWRKQIFMKGHFFKTTFKIVFSLWLAYDNRINPC